MSKKRHTLCYFTMLALSGIFLPNLSGESKTGFQEGAASSWQCVSGNQSDWICGLANSTIYDKTLEDVTGQPTTIAINPEENVTSTRSAWQCISTESEGDWKCQTASDTPYVSSFEQVSSRVKRQEYEPEPDNKIVAQPDKNQSRLVDKTQDALDRLRDEVKSIGEAMRRLSGQVMPFMEEKAPSAPLEKSEIASGQETETNEGASKETESPAHHHKPAPHYEIEKSLSLLESSFLHKEKVAHDLKQLPDKEKASFDNLLEKVMTAEKPLPFIPVRPSSKVTGAQAVNHGKINSEPAILEGSSAEKYNMYGKEKVIRSLIQEQMNSEPPVSDRMIDSIKRHHHLQIADHKKNLESYQRQLPKDSIRHFYENEGLDKALYESKYEDDFKSDVIDDFNIKIKRQGNIENNYLRHGSHVSPPAPHTFHSPSDYPDRANRFDYGMTYSKPYEINSASHLALPGVVHDSMYGHQEAGYRIKQGGRSLHNSSTGRLRIKLEEERSLPLDTGFSVSMKDKKYVDVDNLPEAPDLSLPLFEKESRGKKENGLKRGFESVANNASGNVDALPSVMSHSDRYFTMQWNSARERERLEQMKLRFPLLKDAEVIGLTENGSTYYVLVKGVYVNMQEALASLRQSGWHDLANMLNPWARTIGSLQKLSGESFATEKTKQENLPQGGYTIQWAKSAHFYELEALKKQFPFLSGSRTVHIRKGSGVEYLLVGGTYSDRISAMEAIAGMSGILTFEGIIQPVARPIASFENVWTGGFLKREPLRSKIIQDAPYTIEWISSVDPSMLSRIKNRYPYLKDALVVNRRNKYLLVQGVFRNDEEAHEALELPGVRQLAIILNPSIRSISSLMSL